MPKNKFTTISIPVPLADKVKEFIDGTGFTSMSDFVTFMLREVIAGDAVAGETEKERKKIRERLKALGYIN
jgi:Arc/MetJ-type ribon-helix-helix transcriptional regulator